MIYETRLNCDDVFAENRTASNKRDVGINYRRVRVRKGDLNLGATGQAAGGRVPRGR